MMNIMKEFLVNESGATAIEYGLIASLIAVALIVGARTLGTQLNSTFNDISSTMSDANQAGGVGN